MPHQTVAVIGAMNEEKSIANVVRQVRLAGVGGMVIICNGCTDGTLSEIRKASNQGAWPLRVVWSSRALGHDVSRSVGTYTALRHFPAATRLLYVDADWAGTFAPNLAEFAAHHSSVDSDVLSLTWSCLDGDGELPRQLSGWRTALRLQDKVPSSAVPFVLPMMIHRRAFQSLSPLWLANPGLWFAYAANSPIDWATYPNWQFKWTGHRTRSRAHHQDMAQRIDADSRTAIALLSGRPYPYRTQAFLSLPPRDETFLETYAASVSYIDPPQWKPRTNPA